MARTCRDIRARAKRLAIAAILAAAWTTAQSRTPPPRPPAAEPVRPAPEPAGLAEGVGLRKGLVLHLAFEGEGAKVKDLSGKDNGGTIYGGKRAKEGKRGKGCYLDGNGDRVQVNNSATIEIRPAVSVAAWVKLASFERRGYGNEHGYIVNKGRDLWWNPAFFLGYSKSKTGKNPAMFHVCRHGAAQHGGGKTVVGTTNMVPGKWTHLAGTYDGKQLKIYVNGAFQKAAAYTGPLRADRAPLLVGGGSLNSTGWGNHFTVNGTVDDVMVWNRALSADEIRSLYHGTTEGGVYVERLATADRVKLTDGTTVTGTILAASYAATTAFGKIEIPAHAVAGFVRAAKTGAGLRFALFDGQVVAATPTDRTLRITLADSQVREIPLAKIASCGYRVTPGRPAIRAPAGPTVTLRGGSRLLLKAAPARLPIKTPYGTVALPGTRVVRVDAIDRPAGHHRVKTAGGSTLSGTLTEETLKLQLALGPSPTVRREDVLALTTAVRPAKTAATVIATMGNGDQLHGTLGGKTLAIKTEFGDIAPDLSAVRSISHNAATGTTKLTMRDGTIPHGKLAGKLVLSLGGGLSLPIPTDRMASITSVGKASGDKTKPVKPPTVVPPPPPRIPPRRVERLRLEQPVIRN